jgi:hypothetical protein
LKNPLLLPFLATVQYNYRKGGFSLPPETEHFNTHRIHINVGGSLVLTAKKEEPDPAVAIGSPNPPGLIEYYIFSSCSTAGGRHIILFSGA